MYKKVDKNMKMKSQDRDSKIKRSIQLSYRDYWLWHVIENSKPDLPFFYSAFFSLLSKTALLIQDISMLLGD